MGKRGMLKKFFSIGKTKPSNASFPVCTNTVATVSVNPKQTFPETDDRGNAAEETKPPSEPQPGACANAETRSECKAMENESDRSGGHRWVAKGVENFGVQEEPLATNSLGGVSEPQAISDTAPETEEGRGKLPPKIDTNELCSLTDALAVNNEPADVVDSAPDFNAESACMINECCGKIKASPEKADISDEHEIVCCDEIDKEANMETEEGCVKVKETKRKWAEKRISELDFSSCSKPAERLKVDVEQGLNAERRKWIEGLSSPGEVRANNTPDDVKKLGNISDKMKAVEHSFRRKDDDPCLPRESPSRGKATAQWMAIEKRRRSQNSLKSDASMPPPGKASVQKKAVEEMLRQLHSSKSPAGKAEASSPESLP